MPAAFPPGIRAEEVSVSAPVSGALGGEALLLVHAGAPVVLARREDGPYWQLALSGPRPVRLRGEVLHLSLAHGELLVPVGDWLELENVRLLLSELPQAGASEAVETARLTLVAELLRPHLALAQTLDHRAVDPAAPRRSTMPLDLQRIEQELSTATAEEIARLAELLRNRWQLPRPGPTPATDPGRFSVVLAPYQGNNKINAIKALREVSALGLAEAKRTVEEGGPVLAGADAFQAEQVRGLLAQAGLEVTISREG